jgi:hypothetical protein
MEKGSDRERLVRIETILQSLATKVDDHIIELRKHIRDDLVGFNEVKEAVALHLQEARMIRKELDQVMTDVMLLKNDRIRFLAWIAAITAFIGLGWFLLDFWFDHALLGSFQKK